MVINIQTTAVFRENLIRRYRWAWCRLSEILRPAVAFEFWFTLLYVTVFTAMSDWV